MSWQLFKAIRKHSPNFQRRFEVFKTFFFQFVKRRRGKIKLDSEVGEIKLDNWGDHSFVLGRTSQLPAVASMSLVLLAILGLIIQTQGKH